MRRSFAGSTIATISCSHCGARVAPSAGICDQCGHLLNHPEMGAHADDARPYHISFQAKYEPYATEGQRSLGWLAPELVDAGLTLTEGNDMREWTGTLDADTYARFADAWGLMDGERVFDGMEFETDESSPIVYVNVSVRELTPAAV